MTISTLRDIGQPSIKEVVWNWVRRRTMGDWVKIGISLAGAAAVAWTMLQLHEYRLNQMEHGFEKHLIEHDQQYREISNALHGIDLSIARMRSEGMNYQTRKHDGQEAIIYGR